MKGTLMNNANLLTPEVLNYLIDANLIRYDVLLCDVSASMELLTVLANADTGWSAKRDVALHGNVSEKTLQDLSVHRDFRVRCAVASSRNSPAVVLEHLSHDARTEVLLNVAENSNAPGMVLAELGREMNHARRVAVASNPNTPTSVLIKFSQMKSPAYADVRDIATRSLRRRG